jgi:hypothetical protein
MSREAPREDPFEGMPGVMPYGAHCVMTDWHWTLCLCGKEFPRGARIFYVKAVQTTLGPIELCEWVCAECAAKAFAGQDISTEMVLVQIGRKERRVPRWWAEERGIHWFGQDGLAAEFADRPKPPEPVKIEPVKPDPAVLQRRQELMAEPFGKAVKQSLFG